MSILIHTYRCFCSEVWVHVYTVCTQGANEQENEKAISWSAAGSSLKTVLQWLPHRTRDQLYIYLYICTCIVEPAAILAQVYFRVAICDVGRSTPAAPTFPGAAENPSTSTAQCASACKSCKTEGGCFSYSQWGEANRQHTRRGEANRRHTRRGNRRHTRR